jgi:hypothetical protein
LLVCRAIEIEQPFGDDANDLPIEDYIANLESVLLEMLPGRSPKCSEREDASAALTTCGSDSADAAKAAVRQQQAPTSMPPTHGAPQADGRGASPTRVKSTTTWTRQVDYEYDHHNPAAADGAVTLPVPRSVPPAPPAPEPQQPTDAADRGAAFAAQYQSYLARMGNEQRGFAA